MDVMVSKTFRQWLLFFIGAKDHPQDTSRPEKDQKALNEGETFEG